MGNSKKKEGKQNRDNWVHRNRGAVQKTLCSIVEAIRKSVGKL